ncbi:hypothetical protein PC128_g24928 [Phytophthora cactorum]|nr:hypothetical protein PC128_g24928 [Phytophthora cactorum]
MEVAPLSQFMLSMTSTDAITRSARRISSDSTITDPSVASSPRVRLISGSRLGFSSETTTTDPTMGETVELECGVSSPRPPFLLEKS